METEGGREGGYDTEGTGKPGNGGEVLGGCWASIPKRSFVVVSVPMYINLQKQE